MGRRLALLAAVTSLALVAGCGPAALIGLIDDLGDGNDDPNTTRLLLSREWTVARYSGSVTGAVEVPAAAAMRLFLDSDGTFQLTSDEAVSIGGGLTRRYDEVGRWRITSTSRRTLAVTLTRAAGDAVPVDDRAEVAGSYVLDGNSLVLTTTAFGPGNVRYVMTGTP